MKPAPKGNQYALALSDPKIRQKAYKSFCDHLAKGKAVKSWYYDADNHLCCWETMMSYIENNPGEFDPVHKKIGWSKGYQLWEKIADESAEGKNKKANTASLQMVMRNKYGWDKRPDTEEKQDTESLADLKKKAADGELTQK